MGNKKRNAHLQKWTNCSFKRQLRLIPKFNTTISNDKDINGTCHNCYIQTQTKRVTLINQTLSANSIVRSSITVKKLDATEAILYMIDYLIEHDLYELALFRFGVGTRHLMKWKSETNDKEILNGINEQYRLYKKRAKTMLAHVDFLDRVRLILFCINFNLYSFIRNVIKWLAVC